MFYCQQYSIDHLQFWRVLCNRPSWFFLSLPYAPIGLLNAPPPPSLPVQASSGQEWNYCRSAGHLVTLRVRLMCGQMYPSPHHPSIPPWCPQVETSGGQKWYKLRSLWSELMFYCLQYSIDHLEFSLYTPTPVQASSGQEQNYIR